MAYGSEIMDRQLAYGPKVTTEVAYALQFERPPWRWRLKALEGHQRLDGDLTGDNGPSTGQKVRERMIHDNTYKKIHVCTHHNENYTMVTVLHQHRH